MGPATPFASSEALAAMLGMTAVGVSLCGQPMHASDARTARLEDRQFVLGEGPLVDAFGRRRPIEAPDTTDDDEHGWAHLDLAADGVGATFAFPLLVAEACLGALTLYREVRGALSDGQRTIGAIAADTAALETAALLLDARVADRDVPALRPIHELQHAVGVVMDQLVIDGDEAISRIRAHAFRTDRPLSDVVADLRMHRLHLRDDRAPITGSG